MPLTKVPMFNYLGRQFHIQVGDLISRPCPIRFVRLRARSPPATAAHSSDSSVCAHSDSGRHAAAAAHGHLRHGFVHAGHIRDAAVREPARLSRHPQTLSLTCVRACVRECVRAPGQERLQVGALRRSFV